MVTGRPTPNSFGVCDPDPNPENPGKTAEFCPPRTDVRSSPQWSPDPAARLQPQTLDALWTDLAGKDATRAFDALRTLSASPDQAVRLIQERVRPAASPDSKRLAQLLSNLDNRRVDVPPWIDWTSRSG